MRTTEETTQVKNGDPVPQDQQTLKMSESVTINIFFDKNVTVPAEVPDTATTGQQVGATTTKQGGANTAPKVPDANMGNAATGEQGGADTAPKIPDANTGSAATGEQGGNNSNSKLNINIYI